VTLRDALVDLAVACVAGALVGVERQQAQAGKEDQDFGGIRTFPLVAVLGCVGALLVPAVGAWPLVALLGGVIALVGISHFRAPDRNLGLTSEIAALVTFGAGAVAGTHLLIEEDTQRYLFVASISAVTMGLLSLKQPLHGFVARLSPDDLYATAKFVLLALVVIPILPNRTYGPLDVINPFKIGVMIALVAGISFAGYVAARTIGGGRGLLVTGLIGGLVSSTAVTMTFAGRAKEEPKLTAVSAVAIGAASATMFARIVVVVGAVDRGLLSSLAAPLVTMALVGFGVAAVVYRRDAQEQSSEPVPLRNPFELKKAIQFGLLYGVVLFVAKAAQTYLGTAGILGSAVLAGLTDVDAITLSLSELHRQGLAAETAALGITVAAITNTLVKMALAWSLGGITLGKRVAMILGAAIVTGGAVALFVAR
jgi:uncharacterized membrane protein (DUF4010 family)